MAACQRGDAGPRRRDLNWDMFSPDSLSVGPDSNLPTTEDYTANLDLFNGPISDSSDGGDLSLGGQSDYAFDPSQTGSSDLNSGDWSLDSVNTASSADLAPSANLDLLASSDASISTEFDLFGSDYIADSSCSDNTVVSGKVRRDDSMCLNRGDTKTPTKPVPKIPNTEPGLPPSGPNVDPAWVKFFDKPSPRMPNQVPDPRFDNQPVEPPDVVPTTDIVGPCRFGYKYLCCDLGGQVPPFMSDKPIEQCEQCMSSPGVSTSPQSIPCFEQGNFPGS